MSGANIRAIREALGLKQDAVARAARIPQPHLSAVEAGKKNLSLQSAQRLAAALNTTIDALLDKAA